MTASNKKLTKNGEHLPRSNQRTPQKQIHEEANNPGENRKKKQLKGKESIYTSQNNWEKRWCSNLKSEEVAVAGVCLSVKWVIMKLRFLCYHHTSSTTSFSNNNNNLRRRSSQNVMVKFILCCYQIYRRVEFVTVYHIHKLCPTHSVRRLGPWSITFRTVILWVFNGLMYIFK